MIKKIYLPAGRQVTKSFRQTQKLGEELAKKILMGVACGQDFGAPKAVVLGLRGNLGGGKTTFLQGFAEGLGIKEKILSPTFVILKHFRIPAEAKSYKLKAISFTDFYHFDCYRINKPEEILELGFKEIISNPKNIVAIEWSEKISAPGGLASGGKNLLPKNTIFIDFKFIDKNKREIKIGI